MFSDSHLATELHLDMKIFNHPSEVFTSVDAIMQVSSLLPLSIPQSILVRGISPCNARMFLHEFSMFSMHFRSLPQLSVMNTETSEDRIENEHY